MTVGNSGIAVVIERLEDEAPQQAIIWGILNDSDKSLTPKQIADKTNEVSYGYIRNILGKMVDKGLLVKKGKRYAAVTSDTHGANTGRGKPHQKSVEFDHSKNIQTFKPFAGEVPVVKEFINKPGTQMEAPEGWGEGRSFPVVQIPEFIDIYMFGHVVARVRMSMPTPGTVYPVDMTQNIMNNLGFTPESPKQQNPQPEGWGP